MLSNVINQKHAMHKREAFHMHAYVCALTVVALGACVGGHGAVAGVVLPLLDANAHVCTGVLLTCGTRTCIRANVILL